MMTPERIARNVFGGADWLKVQSQHERFLKEIEKLPEDKRAGELLNAVKYLLTNKSDYWLETAHLLHLLLGDDKREGYYKRIDQNLTKKAFCEKHLKMNYETVADYIQVITQYKRYGFTEEQLRVLGLSKTQEIMDRTHSASGMSKYSKMTLEELSKLKRSQIRGSRPQLYYLQYHWNKAAEGERKQFLRWANARVNSKLDQKADHS